MRTFDTIYRHLFFAECWTFLVEEANSLTFFVGERSFITQTRKMPINAKCISYLVADHSGTIMWHWLLNMLNNLGILFLVNYYV